MQKHKVYFGFFKNDHYFVEVKKGLFDEWNLTDIRNMVHEDIVKWRLRERERRSRVMLMTIGYIKRGCGITLKLLKTVGRKGVVKI